MTPADRASFLRCRRQWDFGAHFRRNLEPIERPAAPDLEAALRETLAIYYFPGMWDWERTVTLPLVVQGFERAMTRQQQAAGDAVDAQTWQDQRSAGLRALDRYFSWAPEVDPLSPVLVEPEYEVNVPSPDDPEAGLVTADGAPIRYRGRVDMLAVDAHDAYWIVRHRLVSGPWPPTGELLADTETLTACWAWEQFYIGMTIEGIIYNEIRLPDRPGQPGQPDGAEQAGQPEPATGGPPGQVAGPAAAPRPGRPGWLRRRWTGGLRRGRDAERWTKGAPRRVRQHEPSGGGRSIPQHRRMYAAASKPAQVEPIEQWTGEHFRRTWLRRSPAEVAAAGQRLACDVAEMTADPAIRPNPSVLNCPACDFLDPCLAIFAGADAEPLIASSYRERPPDTPLEGRLGSRAWSVGRGAAPPRFRGG